MAVARASLDQRVYQAVVNHFRQFGASPSYREIAQAVSRTVSARHIRRPLDNLQRAGLLTFSPGVPKSIVLADRMANFSDAEWELSGLRRGYPIGKSRLPALGAAFAQRGTELGMETPSDMTDLLNKLA